MNTLGIALTAVAVIATGAATLVNPHTSIKYPYDYLDAVLCAFSAENLKPDYCAEIERLVKEEKERRRKEGKN